MSCSDSMVSVPPVLAFAHIAASVLELPRASANKQIRLQQSHEDHYSVSKSFHHQKGLRPGHDRPF